MFHRNHHQPANMHHRYLRITLPVRILQKGSSLVVAISLNIFFVPINLPVSAFNKKLLKPYKKSVEIRPCCPFHVERPSHCPIRLNEQRETHADVFI